MATYIYILQYIHYEVDQDDLNRMKQANMSAAVRSLNASSQSDFKMMAPQVRRTLTIVVRDC